MAVRATFRSSYYLATPPTGYTVATHQCRVGAVKNSGTSFVPHAAEVTPVEGQRRVAAAGSRTRAIRTGPRAYPFTWDGAGRVERHLLASGFILAKGKLASQTGTPRADKR